MSIPKDLTGYEYTTKKTTIRVIRKTDIKSDGKYLYEVFCDVCSKDKELFPDPILFSRFNILNGQVSCGCGKNPTWSKYQFEVSVQRSCESYGYEFCGLVEPYINSKTKIKIKDPKTGHVWETQTINKVLSRGPKNPHLYSKPDDEFIKEMQDSGKYVDGTLFLKIDGIWHYKCPVCSNDDTTNEGLCTGLFKTTRSNLRKGKLSCRCSKTYRPTQKEVVFKVNKLLQGKGTLISTGDWYRNSRSKFKYTCEKCKNEVTTDYHSLAKGSGCPDCCVTGYSTSKPGRLYLVRWFSDKDPSLSFIKFGITNLQLKSRTRRQKSESGLCLEVIMDLYFTDGKIPKILEDAIKSKFKTKVVNKSVFPDGYTETLNLTDLECVINFVNNYTMEFYNGLS